MHGTIYALTWNLVMRGLKEERPHTTKYESKVDMVNLDKIPKIMSKKQPSIEHSLVGICKLCLQLFRGDPT